MQSEQRLLVDVCRDIRRRQVPAREAQPFAELVGRLMSRRGYGQAQARRELGEIWETVVGTELARHSRPGNIRRRVLEVIVDEASVMQELVFQKRQILTQLKQQLQGESVRELRFISGSLR